MNSKRGPAELELLKTPAPAPYKTVPRNSVTFFGTLHFNGSQVLSTRYPRDAGCTK